MKTSARAYRALRLRLWAGVLALGLVALGEIAMLCHHSAECNEARVMQVQTAGLNAGWMNLR